MKNQKGVTLIALVVTIVVLLILAGVAIAMLRGDNGILTETTKAASETKIGEATEAVSNAINELTTEFYDKKYVTNTAGSDTVGSYVKKGLLELVEENKTLNGKVTISETSNVLTIRTVEKDADKKVAQATYTVDTEGKGTLSNWTRAE